MVNADWTPCDPGDWINVNQVVYIVERMCQDMTMTPDEIRTNIVTENPASWFWSVDVIERKTQERFTIRLHPTHATALRHGYSRAGRVSKVERLDDHHAVCGECGEPWPCWHFSIERTMNSDITALENKQQYEREHQHPCLWCKRMVDRDVRFKTVRGMNGHIRRCDSNPNTWDLAKWVPFITERVTIGGGYMPGHGGSEAYESDNQRAAAALMVLAKQGVDAIPETRDELFTNRSTP